MTLTCTVIAVAALMLGGTIGFVAISIVRSGSHER
jgi:hypothetical protein